MGVWSRMVDALQSFGYGLFFVLALVVGAGFFWVHVKFRGRAENAGFVHNLKTGGSGGFAEGLLESVEVGRGGRRLVTFRPIDVDVSDSDCVGGDGLCRVVVGSEGVLEIPRGSAGGSRFRDIFWLLPELPSGLCAALRGDAGFGAALSLYVLGSRLRGTSDAGFAEYARRVNELYADHALGVPALKKLLENKELSDDLVEASVRKRRLDEQFKNG